VLYRNLAESDCLAYNAAQRRSNEREGKETAMTFRRDDRRLFDRSANEYDAIRPGYPEALIEDLIRQSAIPDAGRILEIGCGTGQLTAPLAARGYEIVAVELGEDLARIASENLNPYLDATVICADFERWEPEPDTFDLITSAQAFHWIDPEIGYPKAHTALRPDGHLALIWNLFPGSNTPVYRALHKLYRTHAPQLCRRPGRRPLEERVERTMREIDASGLFLKPEIRQYPWVASYTKMEYTTLLRTFSDHLALEPAALDRLLGAVGTTIEQCSGTIDRPQVATLFLAQPRESARSV